MGIFRSKKDKEVKEKDKSEIAKATFKVIIKEKLGSVLRTVKEFEAQRFIDPEDHVVYIRSEKQNFWEIFPEDMKDFANYTEGEIRRKLAQLKQQLKKEREQDTEEVNDKNLEFEILKLEAKLRSFAFSRNSSYITFDEKGKPTFYFLREGSSFHPLKWDADTKTVYTPSDNKKKKAAIALRNKQNKYNTQSMLTTASIIIFVVLVISAGISIWMGYKAFEKYDASEIAQAERACLESLGNSAKSLEQSSKNIQDITKDLDKQINKPQSIIGGIAPR